MCSIRYSILNTRLFVSNRHVWREPAQERAAYFHSQRGETGLRSLLKRIQEALILNGGYHISPNLAYVLKKIGENIVSA